MAEKENYRYAQHDNEIDCWNFSKFRFRTLYVKQKNCLHLSVAFDSYLSKTEDKAYAVQILSNVKNIETNNDFQVNVNKIKLG